MNNNETAEAIIVVGPFLWKCVNCDLLLSRQHSIDDHLASYHKSSLRPDEPTNAQCGLAVCGCHKSSYISEGRKDILKKRNARKRKKISIPSDQEETNKFVKAHSPSKTLQEEDQGSAGYEETDGGTVENSMIECKDTSIDKENDTFHETTDSNNAEDHAGKENRTKSCGDSDSDSENDISGRKQCSVDLHVDEGEIFASEERIEREAKHKLDEQDGQNTRKSRRSTKGKNSLYHEYEMGLS